MNLYTYGATTVTYRKLDMIWKGEEKEPLRNEKYVCLAEFRIPQPFLNSAL